MNETENNHTKNEEKIYARVKDSDCKFALHKKYVKAGRRSHVENFYKRILTEMEFKGLLKDKKELVVVFDINGNNKISLDLCKIGEVPNIFDTQGGINIIDK